MSRILNKKSIISVLSSFALIISFAITSQAANPETAITASPSGNKVFGNVFDDELETHLWDEESPLNSSTRINLFGNEENNILKPGSNGIYKFTVSDTSTKKLFYEITFSNGMEDTLKEIPILYRIYTSDDLANEEAVSDDFANGETVRDDTANGKFVSEEQSPWYNLADLESREPIKGVLSDNGSRDYYIEWKWPWNTIEDLNNPINYETDTALATSEILSSGKLTIHVAMEMEEDPIIPQQSANNNTNGNISKIGNGKTGRTTTSISKLVKTAYSNGNRFVKTGDNANLILLVIMCITSISLVIYSFVYFKHKNDSKK
ncbi:MAG: hypothetical protein LBM02_06060 [Lachnospiraceae bacterium]|jgi:hypothetical protein|nr:hypothetical protein [Lachnospiraceae bacterium]